MKKILTLILFASVFFGQLNCQDALFEVQNEAGISIFSVHPDGIRIKGMKLNATEIDFIIENTEGVELFKLEPAGMNLFDSEGKRLLSAEADSIRFYVYEDDLTDDSRGGFAVTTVGSTSDDYGIKLLDLTPKNYFIGHESGRFTTGWFNSFMGYHAGYHNESGTHNLFFGYQSGYNNISGNKNAFFGYKAGYTNEGSTHPSHLLGDFNAFFGSEAGSYSTGSYNTFIGENAGKYNYSGVQNTFVGRNAGFLSGGTGNTGVGSSTKHSNGGSFNSTFGQESAFYNTGSNNVFIGCKSGYGTYNASTGSNNACLGNESGRNITGSYNVMLGNRAGFDHTGSGKLYIANGATADSTLIYGDFAAQSIGIAHLSPSTRLSLGGSGSANGIALGGDQAESCVLYHSSTALKMSAPNSRFQFGSLEYIQDGGAFETEFNSDLRPSINNNYDLGTSSYRWQTVYATNGVINTSDIRDKENISALSYGLAEILQMNPVAFNWLGRSNEGRKLGLVAQELLAVVPEVVKTHEEELISEDSDETQLVEMERYGIYYADLIPVLIKGMQDQQTLISELNNVIYDQQQQIDELTFLINEIITTNE